MLKSFPDIKAFIKDCGKYELVILTYLYTSFAWEFYTNLVFDIVTTAYSALGTKSEAPAQEIGPFVLDSCIYTWRLVAP